MKKSTFNISTLALITLLISFGINGFAYADEEALGQAAEVEGKFRQALIHYVEALKTDATNQHLRVKIIKLAQKIQPPPAVPKEAERYLARGEVAVETAKDEEGYTRAAGEFKKALRIAPWLADGYFNLGVVLDKAGKYDDAIENLKIYLIAVPGAKEAEKLMYKIEFRQEEAQRAKKEEREKENEAARFVRSLAGRWYGEGDEVITSLYVLVPTGENTFELKFEAYVSRGRRSNEDNIKIFELKVTDYFLDGIYRSDIPIVTEMCGFFDAKPRVSGFIGRNGRIITLTTESHTIMYGYGSPGHPNCGRSTRSERTATFRRR